MAQETLQEVTRYSININKNEEPLLSWYNSFITLKTFKGLSIFEISRNSQCLEKKVNCLETLVDTTKTSPASDIFSNVVITSKFSNQNVHEMIMDPTLWPHNLQLLQEDTCIKAFEWSPNGLVDKNLPALAVLNNIGGIDIYIKGLKWKCVLNMANLVGIMFAKQSILDFEELRAAVHELASTAMCWSPLLNPDKSCFFTTGQKNGSIVFWSMTFSNMMFNADFLARIESITYEITDLKWIPKENNTFYLICSDIMGQITLLHFEFNGIFELLSSHVLWPYKDKMISDIEYIVKENYTLLFCNKNRHLLVLMVDENLALIDQYTHNLNDHRISSIYKHDKSIYVTTINGFIFKLNDDFIDGNKLNIKYTNIECKDVITPTHEIHGISFSPNKVMCALALIDRKVLWRKDVLKLDIVLVSNTNIEPLFKSLLDNETKKLSNFADVIELLRFRLNKQKEWPLISINELYDKCCKDLYLLKLYYVMSTIYIYMLKSLRVTGGLPPVNKSPEQIKLEILTLHAKQKLNSLYKKYTNTGELSVFESETFVGVKKFLEYNCKCNKTSLLDEFSSDVLSVVKSSDFVYTCQCCESKLREFMCENYHLNMYCVLSLTPIESDSYLACNWCQSTARLEVMEDDALCLFCDVHMNLVE